MAHLLAPQPSDPNLPVFFNVDSVVGAAPSQNLREDVLLVQFCFQVIANDPRNSKPEVIAASKRVKVTGSIDAATIDAIRATQQVVRNTYEPRTVVDGRVSPARGGYSYGGGKWTIVYLNNAIQCRHVDTWPRIDKVSGCPSELKTMVSRTVAGT